MGRCCWPSTGAAGLDVKAKVSAVDTTTDFLNPKVVAGAGIATAILNPGANEQLQIAATGGGEGLARVYLPAKLFDYNPSYLVPVFQTRDYTNGRAYGVWTCADDPNTRTRLHTAVPMPGWDGNSISGYLYWSTFGATSHGNDVNWKVNIASLGDNELISLGGNFVNAHDSEAQDKAMNIKAWGPLVPSGTPAADECLNFAVERANGDPASEDADFIAISIVYGLA